MARHHLLAAVLALAALPAAAGVPFALENRRPQQQLSGPYVWDLKLANGMTAHWETVDANKINPGEQVGQSEWFHNGHPIGKRRVELQPSKLGMLAQLARTEDEDVAAYEIGRNTPALDAAEEQFNALLDKINAECSRLPEARQAACTGKFDAQVQALQARVYAEKDAVARKQDAVSAVCTEVNMRLRDGQVSGTASNCGAPGEVAVSGTYRPARTN